MKKIAKQISKFGKCLLIFGIFFSQLSFPLEVLADELTNNEETTIEESNETPIISEEPTTEDPSSNTDEVTPTEEEQKPTEEEQEESKYQVMINNQEVTDYTIHENESKIISITQNYQGEGEYIFDNNIESIDFTNKLYGTYQYTFSVSNSNGILESKTITINYLGDNSNILNQYTNSNITYTNESYIVLGTTNASLTVATVLNQFNQEELKNNYDATIYIKDSQGNILNETDVVVDGCKLVLSNNIIEKEYQLTIVGDYNKDGIVDQLDKTSIVDGILANEEANLNNDLNQDGEFNVLDATHPIFTTNSWENNVIALDTLTNALQNKEEISLGEEIQVKYHMNGFEFDQLTGIEGKLTYDKNLLELTNIEINKIYGGINEEGKFIYLLDNYSSNGILMTITFKAIAPGESQVSIDNIIASLGAKANLESNSISTNIKVLDYGKGGDEEDNNQNVNNQPTPTVPTPSETVLTTQNVKNTNSIKTIALSTDNYIKSLTIKGHNLEFNMYKYEYALTVKNNVKSLDLNVVLNSADSSFYVEGNKDFKVGENTVSIVVKAENGSSRTYTIKVNKEKSSQKEKQDKEDSKEKEETNSSKTIIIILIILVIIGLIYVIFKDDEDEKKESKK